ncbi:neuropeptide-like 1 isoform X2 [Prorops nasuta]|uniref:neuropeptide-like 1 isoform X2 n=1 Tax=Prorops nasuta TaxID=863751 RepID=UPI0034CF0711
MGFTGNYFISFLLCVAVVNEVRLPTVTCQNEEGALCFPKKLLMELVGLPELRSRMSKRPNLQDFADDQITDEICLPDDLYLEFAEDPGMREFFALIDRAQSYRYDPRFYADLGDIEPKKLQTEMIKRSLATLAKNDDLPTTVRERPVSGDDEEKRSVASRLIDEERRKNMADAIQDYTLPNGEIDVVALARDYPYNKRNVGSVARDYGLPSGKRNVASLARDYGLPSGKRNVASLARDRMLPLSGKTNAASSGRGIYLLPQSVKRNVAALARDYALPTTSVANLKRYLGSLAISDGLPNRQNDDTLARNGDWSVSKRSFPPGGLIIRTLNRHGRSLTEKQLSGAKEQGLKLSHDASSGATDRQEADRNNNASQRSNDVTTNDAFLYNGKSHRRSSQDKRIKRSIDSDDYPYLAVQNANFLDYEDLIEALSEHYPRAVKRFMGRIPQMGPRPTTPPTRQLGR